MIEFLAMMALLFPGVSSFVKPGQARTARRCMVQPNTEHSKLSGTSTSDHTRKELTWSPQDLTKDNPGFRKIPDDDYIKIYQENPELWPVEFFLIAYRRARNDETRNTETQVLVRKSSNGTSKYGLGTGVPATRWMMSTAQPPRGYEWSEPTICFEASKFPEFDNNQQQTESWSYHKIDIREDAFHSGQNSDDTPTDIFEDPELEKYASAIRDNLSATMQKNEIKEGLSSWEGKRNRVVQNILDSPNSVAAIQGTLRMSGLFEKRRRKYGRDDDEVPSRYVDLGERNSPDPLRIAKSAQIYTMFPQMPDPMPLPSTSPEELKKEISSRYSRITEACKDPHKDEYGRTFTHISTSNVSNTIHGVYFSLNLTDHLPESNFAFDENDNEIVPPAFDLFGTNAIKREWKSLQELKVLDSGGEIISTEDPKSTFISGFIVRQLVEDGIIGIGHRDQ